MRKSGLFAAMLLAAVVSGGVYAPAFADDEATVNSDDQGGADVTQTDETDDTVTIVSETDDTGGGGDGSDEPVVMDDPNVIFYSMAGGGAGDGIPANQRSHASTQHDQHQDSSNTHDGNNCLLKFLGLAPSC